MDDSGEKSLALLISDWVGVLIVAFVLQGLWFGLTSSLTRLDAGLEPALTGISGSLMVPWILATGGALVWRAVVRARPAGKGPGRR